MGSFEQGGNSLDGNNSISIPFSTSLQLLEFNFQYFAQLPTKKTWSAFCKLTFQKVYTTKITMMCESTVDDFQCKPLASRKTDIPQFFNINGNG